MKAWPKVMVGLEKEKDRFKNYPINRIKRA